MVKRKNEYNVKYLVMCPIMQIVEPVTMARFQLKATVEFYPDEFLPEFVDAQSIIRQRMDNKKMTVEGAADMLIDIFNEYEPKGVKVKIDIMNNSAYFSVSVFSESGFATGIDADKKREEKKKVGKKPEDFEKGRVEDDE